MISLHPAHAPLAWPTFVSTSPAYSIAIDGYVCDGPRLNVNHHECVDRPATGAVLARYMRRADGRVERMQ